METPALSIKPVQIESPIGTLGQLASLRAQQTENFLRQQQMRESQARIANDQAVNQQKQRDLADQQKLQSIVADPSNHAAFAAGDYSQILKAVNPTVAEPAIKSLDTMRAAASAHDKDQSAIDAAAREELSKSLSTIDPASPDAAETANGMVKNFAAGSPSHAKIAEQIGTFDPTNFQQDFKAKTALNNLAFNMLDYRAKQQQETATAAKAGTEAEQALRLISGTNAVGQTAEQQQQLAETEKQRAETARHNQQEEAHGNQQIALTKQERDIEAGRLAVEKQRFGFESGGGVSDAAKSIAKLQVSPDMVRQMLRQNPGLISQVEAYSQGAFGREFDVADLDKRFNTLKEFTNTSVGKAGGQALALNTLIQHAELYRETAEALKNGSFVPGNALYNKVASVFGSAPPTQANLVARFFAGETGKVATGGVPAEGEIKGILGSLGSSSSPDQIKGAADSLLGIAAGRLTSLQDRVKDAKLEGVVNILGPEAKQVLAKNGFDPNTMKKQRMVQARDASGKLHEAPEGTQLPAGWKLE